MHSCPCMLEQVIPFQWFRALRMHTLDRPLRIRDCLFLNFMSITTFSQLFSALIILESSILHYCSKCPVVRSRSKSPLPRGTWSNRNGEQERGGERESVWVKENTPESESEWKISKYDPFQNICRLPPTSPQKFLLSSYQHGTWSPGTTEQPWWQQQQ